MPTIIQGSLWIAITHSGRIVDEAYFNLVRTKYVEGLNFVSGEKFQREALTQSQCLQGGQK